VVPVRDTLREVGGAPVDRSTIVAVQTPQAFRADALRSALAGDLEGATDCASLVERRGGRVRVVDGDPLLLKVTTQADLEHVERLLAAPG
jgi:2-C-methyl-D-erythritol 4-phosphate cytidylyltransferase